MLASEVLLLCSIRNRGLESMDDSSYRAVGSSFRLGAESEGEGLRKVLNLESLKCHFLDFGEDLTEF
jgi:hypothetical protein